MNFKHYLILISFLVILPKGDLSASPISPKEMFEISSKSKFASLSQFDQIKTLEMIFAQDPKFKSLDNAKQQERLESMRGCLIKEMQNPVYNNFDPMTVVTQCQFKLGYVS